MRRTILVLAALALLFSGGNPVSAVPVTYEEDVVATGSIGATSFTNTKVILTLYGDTSTVTESGLVYTNVVTLGTVFIVGHGLAFMSSPRWVDDAPAYHLLAIGSPPPIDAFLILFSGAFDTYDLRTSLGPLDATTHLAIPPSIHFPTNEGDLVFTAAGDSTFTATTSIPEPSALLLLGSGLAGLWVWGRKKFKCI
jgi:hypothetical protein